MRTIAGVVDREDILTFRLTCRTFAALGLPRQFEVIPVMLFRDSLENLRHISENPVYRNYVRYIDYGPGMVSNPRYRQGWFEDLDLHRWELYKRFSESEVEEACMCQVPTVHLHTYANQRGRPEPRKVL